MDSINTFELSDEQLEMVAGGSQSNESGNVNIAGSDQANGVLGSVLVGSSVGGSNIGQTNVTSQSNYKSKACCYPYYYC
jgi:hypothetical protein